MDTPGQQTVIFVAVTLGTPDRNGIAAETRTETPFEGCMFRPLSAREKAGLVDNIATEVWKCTAPPAAAALEMNAISELKFNAETYQVTGGAQREYDLDGVLDHVSVLCQKQEA